MARNLKFKASNLNNSIVAEYAAQYHFLIRCLLERNQVHYMFRLLVKPKRN